MDSKTFTQRLAQRLGDDPRRTSAMIDTLAGIIRNGATSLTSVAVPSFGTIAAVKHDETVTTDLSTGRRMLLPPQITVEFTPAAMLRKKLSSHE
ncbi:MAG: HU family DNA-binding protein [Bacteroidales bacterium]|nr:HU family DNA-binding protein [Bacteroidales bacterium]